MGLFESDYKRNVLTELERNTRALEEMKANVSAEKITQLQAVVDFVGQAKLLKDTQLAIFQKRLQQIKCDREHEKMAKENSEEICDGYTNPLEMSKKFHSLEEMDAEISSRRAETKSQNISDSATRVQTQTKESDSFERSH